LYTTTTTIFHKLNTGHYDIDPPLIPN
jgi:hypothetical protein